MVWRTKHSLRFITLLFAALTVASAFAQSKDAKPHKRDFKHQVETLEHQWADAQVAGDTTFMDKMLADDYIGISMNGQILTKQQQIARTKNRDLALTTLKLDDIKIKFVGMAAIVTSTAQVEGTNEGMPMNGTYRYTRVYQRVGPGAWRITNFEATRIETRRPGGPPPPPKS